MTETHEKALDQFKREEQAYWAMRDSLMKDYHGLWVAVVNGKVVASGKNGGRVSYEAYSKTGSKVCFCAQVGFENRVFRIRQAAAGYYDLDYFPALPKATILAGALDKNAFESVDFIVDTGADLTIVRTEIADRLGLWDFPRSMANISGIGGIPETRRLYGAKVQLAGTSIPIYVDSRSDIGEDILGRDVINEFELTVCAKRNLVRLQWIEGDGAEA
ncbi:MAG: retroviral-like aspartic protease family protein [candidate division KSB1 bacterium]|nr:retroviral-like aspartic protease family protein [candidate division KSB1 bacterium]MDZ7304610.1 retroviral-like aspartic protease family protein [candidate division KSB1 bacterium]MDZ7313743.1 retroviral-like aspartic protease family protein [candidate division KSB1 bacterium]